MNRIGRVSLVLAALVVASLSVAAQASANTYCAVASGSLPDCTAPNTFTGATTSVQAALNAAATNAGPDKVSIGPGTFTSTANTALTYNPSAAGNNVEIAGQGPSTILSPTTTIGYTFLLAGTGATSNSMHDLTVTIAPGSGAGTAGILLTQNASADLHDISVAQAAPNGSSAAVILNQGSILRNSAVSLPRIGTAGLSTYGVVSSSAAGTGVPVVRDSTVTADIGASAGQGVAGLERLLVERNRINASIGVTTAQGGEVAVRDTLIKLLPDTANPSYSSVGLYSDIFLSGNTTATIDAKNVTIVGGSSPNDIGVWSIASSSGGPIVDASLSSSILADVETSLKRTGAQGVATLEAEYSDFDPATISSTNSGGSGILTQGPGNVNLAPGFVDAAGGDFSLASSSPLIDIGDPAPLGGDESATDLAGNPRILDGNGDGTARRDMGAFEFVPAPPADTTPPETIAGKFKKKVKKGKPAKFEFFSNDPAATFTCALDKKAAKPCASPYTLKRVKKGKHTLTITAIDAAGNADQSPVVDKFKVKKKKKKKRNH
ncbi:MAG: hypothetical protein R2700_01810 [Solirubrobacterales bacterium]